MVQLQKLLCNAKQSPRSLTRRSLPGGPCENLKAAKTPRCQGRRRRSESAHSRSVEKQRGIREDDRRGFERGRRQGST